MNSYPWKFVALVMVGIFTSVSIFMVGSALLFRGRQCVDPEVPAGAVAITYEQTAFPPGTNCIYHYSEGSSVSVIYPLGAGDWLYLLTLAILAATPWAVARVVRRLKRRQRHAITTWFKG